MDHTKPAQWFRMYAEFATDPKVQMLSEADQRRYMMLLCLRCSNGDVTLHDTEVAFQLRINADEWAATKATLVTRKLVTNANLPTAWEKRQKASDSSAARVAKHRSLHKKPSNDDVTLQQRPVEKEGEKEKEKEVSQKQRDATATRLPADWKPSAEDVLFCKTERPDLSPDVVADCFRDYWIAQPGAKGRKTNWPSTWRNWVRKEDPPPQAKGSSSQFLTAQQQRDENNRRSTAEFLADDTPFFSQMETIEGEFSNA